MFRSCIVLSMWLSSIVFAQGRTVVFVAPDSMRAAFLAEINARGRVALDLTEMERALYGPGGGKAQLIAGKPFTLPNTISKEVRADFETGQATCLARVKQHAEHRKACAEQVVAAVWERNLDRLKVERVVEVFLRAEGQVELITYLPGDDMISGERRLFTGTATAFAAEMVRGALADELRSYGMRPNTRDLPAIEAPFRPSLLLGEPQTLPALTVRKNCSVVRPLIVEPTDAPLAITVTALWRATVKPREDLEPLRCKLSLTGPDPRVPSILEFRCKSHAAIVNLFGAQPFTEAAFQARAANLFVASELGEECEVEHVVEQ